MVKKLQLKPQIVDINRSRKKIIDTDWNLEYKNII